MNCLSMTEWQEEAGLVRTEDDEWLQELEVVACYQVLPSLSSHVQRPNVSLVDRRSGRWGGYQVSAVYFGAEDITNPETCRRRARVLECVLRNSAEVSFPADEHTPCFMLATDFGVRNLTRGRGMLCSVRGCRVSI